MQAPMTLITDHVGATLAGATSTLATLAVASQVPAPPGMPAWLPYVGSILGPVLAWLGTRVLLAVAVRQRAIAAAKRARAAALLADANPKNDPDAAALQAEADAADATADALDAARGAASATSHKP